jgi:hypothetical protein
VQSRGELLLSSFFARRTWPRWCDGELCTSLIVRPNASSATTDAGSALTEGTDEAFLGDVGDQHAVLEQSAGRKAEAMGGGW